MSGNHTQNISCKTEFVSGHLSDGRRFIINQGSKHPLTGIHSQVLMRDKYLKYLDRLVKNPEIRQRQFPIAVAIHGNEYLCFVNQRTHELLDTLATHQEVQIRSFKEQRETRKPLSDARTFGIPIYTIFHKDNLHRYALSRECSIELYPREPLRLKPITDLMPKPEHSLELQMGSISKRAKNETERLSKKFAYVASNGGVKA